MYKKKCDICGETYNYEKKHIGKKIKCRKCRNIIILKNRKINNDQDIIEDPKDDLNQTVRMTDSKTNRNYNIFNLISILIIIVFVGIAINHFLINDGNSSNPSNPSNEDVYINLNNNYNSLNNGQKIFNSEDAHGINELLIKNGTGKDAAIKLYSNNVLYLYVYVKSYNEVLIDNIPAGQYNIAFTSGLDWDEDNNEFLKNVAYYKFSDVFEFEVLEKYGGIEYTSYEVTLHPVRGGNAPTKRLDNLDFHMISPQGDSI